MPTMTLPKSVASYITGANAQDVDAVTASFAEDAVVRDEGRSRQGIAAIREWVEEVSKKYHPTVEVLHVAPTEGGTTVAGRVSGNFPGSPVELHYAFTVDGEKITSLEIS